MSYDYIDEKSLLGLEEECFTAQDINECDEVRTTIDYTLMQAILDYFNVFGFEDYEDDNGRLRKGLQSKLREALKQYEKEKN
jgi:hypothetical protein